MSEMNIEAAESAREHPQDAAAAAAAETIDVAVASTKKKSARKEPLRRPRGKRGGLKNRTPAAKAAAAEAALAAKEATKKAVAEAATEHAKQIAQFHTLEKQLARPGLEPEEEARLRAEQEALGGLEAYQDASLLGSDKMRGGETGKWCAQALAEDRGNKDPLRLLDVGALSGTAYQRYSWINTTSIDLNPRADHVQRYDFFKYPAPKAPDAMFDVVSLSLVLNFIGDLSDRGRMILHAHRYVAPGGWLFVVLPLACVSNSRYCTHERMREMFDATGWEVVRQDDSARLTRWLCREKRKTWNKREFKKEEIVKGVTLNNFCIVLRDKKAKPEVPVPSKAPAKSKKKLNPAKASAAAATKKKVVSK